MPVTVYYTRWVQRHGYPAYEPDPLIPCDFCDVYEGVGTLTRREAVVWACEAHHELAVAVVRRLDMRRALT